MEMINRDNAGKIFFAIGVVICLLMFISKASWSILHVDEYWTYSLVNLPLKEAMVVIVNDVHPPLHYLLLYLFNPLGLTKSLYFVKVFSVIPYILIMIVSATKIREDYGWLTAGLFIFSLGVMTDFFVEFLTARMYSWGLFFVLMAFLYYWEVVNNWDRKSWIMLTLFTLLSASTQYFFAITCALIYLLLLIEILQNNRDKIKQFAKSVIALAVLYAPWGYVMIRQIGLHSDEPKDIVHIHDILNYLTFFAIKHEGFSLEILALKVIAVVFLVLLIFLIYKSKDRFSAAGVFLMYATIGLGVIGLALSFSNSMRVRYMIPIMGIFWLSASMVIGKIKDDRILAVMLALVLVLGCAGMVITEIDLNHRFEFNDKKADFLSSINNNDSVVVFNTDYGYRILHNDLNKTKLYTLTDTYFYDNDVEICKDFDQILKNNTGKKVYLVNWKLKDSNKKYEQNYNMTKVYDADHYHFNLVRNASAY